MEEKQLIAKCGHYKAYMTTDDFAEDLNPLDGAVGEWPMWHRHYRLGKCSREFETPGDFERWARGRKFEFMEPVYMYDHSGTSFSMAPFQCPWDSGQVGYVAMTKKDVDSIAKGMKNKSDRRGRCYDYCRSVLDTYTAWSNGWVWIYDVENEDGEVEDSCGGYIGLDQEESGMLADVRAALKRLEPEKEVELVG